MAKILGFRVRNFRTLRDVTLGGLWYSDYFQWNVPAITKYYITKIIKIGGITMENHIIVSQAF